MRGARVRQLPPHDPFPKAAGCTGGPPRRGRCRFLDFLLSRSVLAAGEARPLCRGSVCLTPPRAALSGRHPAAAIDSVMPLFWIVHDLDGASEEVSAFRRARNLLQHHS